jgi:hypothetical protein
LSKRKAKTASTKKPTKPKESNSLYKKAGTAENYHPLLNCLDGDVATTDLEYKEEGERNSGGEKDLLKKYKALKDKQGQKGLL